jgi:hypothetical protein
MHLKFLIAAIVISCSSYAQQVGINTTAPHSSAAFEIYDTSRGILIPRLTKQQRDSIQNPAEGLLIYQKDILVGFWYYSQQQWNQLIEQNNQPNNQNIQRIKTQLYIKP